MKILGTVKRDIYWLFTLESVIIGLLGSTLGVIISCSASKIINHIIVSLADGTGNKPVELFYIPFYVPIAILLTSFIISALTSYYPARRATRIKPLDAMRYE